MWCRHLPRLCSTILVACCACSGAPSPPQSVLPSVPGAAAGAKTSAMFADPQGMAKSREEIERGGPDGRSGHAPTVPADVLDRADHPAPGDAGVDAPR
jgi:hypothetical protein